MKLKSLADMFREYSRIMEAESAYNPACKKLSTYASDIYRDSKYLAEIARSCLLPRGWCANFGLGGSENFVNESVGAHTYLMSTLVDLFLRSEAGRDFIRDGFTEDSYAYQEIMEAIRLHDLPENAIGDWLDNSTRDEAKKMALEDDWYTAFRDSYDYCQRGLYDEAVKILTDMRNKDHPTGRLLFAADKYSLIIATLTCDWLGHSPSMKKDSPEAAGRDHEEMDYCDHREDGVFSASEMFTIDILRLRKLYQFDDTSYFTAILVMFTLMTKGRWYDWRNKNYETDDD